MLWTDIILIIILLVGFFVYFKAKRQLQQGSLQGWLKWAEPFIQVNRQPALQKQPAATANLSAETLSALDNLYREFMEEAASIREDIAVQLDDLRNELSARLTAFEDEMAAAVEKPVPAPTLQAERAHAPQPENLFQSSQTLREAIAPAANPHIDLPASNSAPQQVEVSPPSAPAPMQAPSALVEDEEIEQRRFEILDLLVQGVSADAIARRLNISVAEVELVLHLMQHPGE